ncbi:MAG: EAL domain-containing protein [Smithella sp.]|nr:EAL domain-containing protein [Smithella sp.]
MSKLFKSMFSLFPENDYNQTLRIKRFLIAFVAYIMWNAIGIASYALGLSKAPLSVLIAAVTANLFVNVLLFAVFRTGLNKKANDPSLTLLQMAIATFWIMVVMYYADESRGACLLVYMVVLVFGFFRLRVRQFLLLSLYAWVNFAAVIFLIYKFNPESINMKADILNIIVLAMILPWFAVIGGYINNLRTNISKALTTIERLTDNIKDVIFVVDMQMQYTYVSPSVKSLRGYEPEDVMKQTLADSFAPSSLNKAVKTLTDIMEMEKSGGTDALERTLQLEINLKDGSTVWTETKFSIVRDKKMKAVGILGVSRDITERKRAEEQIEFLATHDNLTQLPNRMMFSHLLNQAIKSARRNKRQFALLFIDLDRFKLINDTLGHDAGDELLKEMAGRFRQSLRAVDVVGRPKEKGDIVGRLGGDEFIILVEEVTDLSHVVTVAQKILNTVMAPMLLFGEECRVTSSIGISVYPRDGEDEQTLMKKADMAMYFAKEEGKNNFQFYSQNIQSQSYERFAIETNLRRALEREEMYLEYQAKVDFKTNTITGVEALLRWKSSLLGHITPTQFIPVAEETGIIVPIGRWVLKNACAQNAAWQRQGLPPVHVAVNLSLRQLMDDKIIDDIRNALDESGLAPHLLELEITESMIMFKTTRLLEVLTKIKAMGVRLALDDFGTGYSSLAQIKNLPIDTLKVDRSFIRNLPEGTEDKAIIEAIIAMGRTLSLNVVAEGVETPEQEKFLREKICDAMQGFYFSKPVAPEQFAELLRKHNTLF